MNLSAGGSQTTSAGGGFQFNNVAAGTHSLTATLPQGFAFASGEVASKQVTVRAGQTTTVNWGARQDNAVVIQLQGLSFSPGEVTISAGTRVRWVNVNGSHTITPDNAQQSGVWTSQTMSGSDEFEHTFNVAGQTYDYHCIPHRSAGMTGRIVVQ